MKKIIRTSFSFALVVQSIFCIPMAFAAEAKTTATAPRAYFDVNDAFWSSNPRLVIDGQTYRPGFLGYQGLASAFASDPVAQKLAQESEAYAKWGSAFVWGGLIGAIGYSTSKSSDEFESDKYWTIFFIGFIPGVIISSIAGRKITRAINQYNGVYGQNVAQFKLGLAPGGLGLRYEF